MQKLKFSIIITTFNRHSLLKRCVEHALNQTCAFPYEVIVVDDGTHPAQPVINNNDNIRYLKTSGKQGVSIARNIGIKNAVGQFVVFCDDDDYFDKNHLQSFANEISKCDNHAGLMLHTQMRKIYEDGSAETIYLAPQPTNMSNSEYLMGPGYMLPSTMCISIDLAKANPFPEKVKYAEDHEQRVFCAENAKLISIPITTVNYSAYTQGVTRGNENEIAAAYVLRWKNLMGNDRFRRLATEKKCMKELGRWVYLYLRTSGTETDFPKLFSASLDLIVFNRSFSSDPMKRLLRLFANLTLIGKVFYKRIIGAHLNLK